MMAAHGLVFLSQTKPLATRAADGTFALTLLAFDRMGPHEVEPWRITWSGLDAHSWYLQNAEQLYPGRPLQIHATRLRLITQGTRGPEFVVRASAIELAPTATESACGLKPVCITSY